MIFFFKKLVSRFFFPVPLAAGLLIAGFVLWAFTRRVKTGRALVLAGIGLLVGLSYPWVSNALLGHLEQQVPPALIATLPTPPSALPIPGSLVPRTRDEGRRTSPISPLPAQSSSLAYVMVLGQGISAQTNRPANLRFKEEFVSRLVEGVRLHRALPGSTLAVSVAGASVAPGEKRRVLNEFLGVFGLSGDQVTLLATARDTADEIQFARRLAGTNRVYLVSCASHLPRALVLARKAGLHAVAAPSSYAVDEFTDSREPFSPERLFPAVESLNDASRAVYEYLGLAWEWVRGR